jgi:hypothetical protein
MPNEEWQGDPKSEKERRRPSRRFPSRTQFRYDQGLATWQQRDDQNYQKDADHYQITKYQGLGVERDIGIAKGQDNQEVPTD